MANIEVKHNRFSLRYSAVRPFSTFGAKPPRVLYKIGAETSRAETAREDAKLIGDVIQDIEEEKDRVNHPRVPGGKIN